MVAVGGVPIHLSVALIAVRIGVLGVRQIVLSTVVGTRKVRLWEHSEYFQSGRTDAVDARRRSECLSGAADGRLREIRRHGHVGPGIVQRDTRNIGKISRAV